jgi:hypothetical protein
VVLALAAVHPSVSQAQENANDVVAVVLGEEIHRAPGIEGQELLGIILVPLMLRYANENALKATELEIDALLEALPGPSESDAAEVAERREVARQLVMSFKISRSLYQEYGGRVVFQQAGPWPIDAYRSFLEERQEAGAFRILDPDLVAGFWEYLADDTRHSFYPSDEAEAAVSTPWWQRPPGSQP